jgi:soluble lytic murein transglycosylase-like protein
MLREPPPCEPVPGPELASLVDWAAREQNLSPLLVREVARQESGFRPCAVSSHGAMGVMQLMPATQIELGVSDPWDARQSIGAGSRLLRQLLDRYHGDLALALSAYNAGAGRVDLAGGIPAIPETRNYVGSILDRLLSPESGATGMGTALSTIVTVPPTGIWEGPAEGAGGGP